MEYLQSLQFVQDLLKHMHLSSHIIKHPDISLSYEIDLGLRKLLYHKDDYASYLHNSFFQSQKNTLYRFFDEYNCHYFFISLPDENESYFFIGPYLTQIPTLSMVQSIMKKKHLDSNMKEDLLKYFSNLPVFEDESILLSITHTLCTHMYKNEDNYKSEYIEYPIPDSYTPIAFSSENTEEKANELTLSILEKNYENEQILMNAISSGNIHLISKAASTSYTQGMEPRTHDSLRDRKNYLIILNTLCRKASEHGGVHPYNIHNVSSNFAKQIETCKTLQQIVTLQEEMIRRYCLLVKQHSLHKYSYLTGKVITLISFDLSANLSLQNIADTFNVNPSYLSNLFHKECGITLTAYVNKKRIERAMTLLQETNKQVQIIAMECGIEDSNYFVKLFKKATGFTPTAFRLENK